MEDFGDEGLSPHAIQTLEAYVPTTHPRYLDENDIVRSPTVVESALEKLFERKFDRVFREVSEDGECIIETLYPACFDKAFVGPSMHRYLSPVGVSLGARMSGSYFLSRVTNDLIAIAASGEVFVERMSLSDEPDRPYPALKRGSLAMQIARLN